jgi:hypothetical protein
VFSFTVVFAPGLDSRKMPIPGANLNDGLSAESLSALLRSKYIEIAVKKAEDNVKLG